MVIYRQMAQGYKFIQKERPLLNGSTGSPINPAPGEPHRYPPRLKDAFHRFGFPDVLVLDKCMGS